MAVWPTSFGEWQHEILLFAERLKYFLTVSSGEVFVDPWEAKLGSQHCGEANIDIIGVQGGLVCVLITEIQNTIVWALRRHLSTYTVYPRHFQWVTSNGFRKRG